MRLVPGFAAWLLDKLNVADRHEFFRICPSLQVGNLVKGNFDYGNRETLDRI